MSARRWCERMWTASSNSGVRTGVIFFPLGVRGAGSRSPIPDRRDTQRTMLRGRRPTRSPFLHIRRRHRHLSPRAMTDIIYTTIGSSALVAVNPHKHVTSNADSILQKYAPGYQDAAPSPHLAHNAYYHMRCIAQDHQVRSCFFIPSGLRRSHSFVVVKLVAESHRLATGTLRVVRSQFGSPSPKKPFLDDKRDSVLPDTLADESDPERKTIQGLKFCFVRWNRVPMPTRRTRVEDR